MAYTNSDGMSVRHTPYDFDFEIYLKEKALLELREWTYSIFR